MLAKHLAVFGVLFFVQSVCSDMESDVKLLREVLCDKDNENKELVDEFSKCLEIYDAIEKEDDPAEECYPKYESDGNEKNDEKEDFFCSLELEKVVQIELCAEFKRQSAENGKILLDVENRFRECMKAAVEKQATSSEK